MPIVQFLTRGWLPLISEMEPSLFRVAALSDLPFRMRAWREVIDGRLHTAACEIDEPR
jgi:hypothetical protein